MMGNGYVRTEAIGVTYRSAAGHSVVALDAISLELPRSTFVALAGPSGSGKSTLLYTLAGLLRPSTGKVLIGDQELGIMSAAQRARFRCENVGFVFQSFQLLPHLRAWENVALSMLPLGVSRSERLRRATEKLSELGLESHVNHRPGELSAGEQQRVAMARAVVNSPSLILADEPTGNLDESNANLVAGQLQELASSAGATVVCATHDERLAQRAHLIVRLAHGVVV